MTGLVLFLLLLVALGCLGTLWALGGWDYADTQRRQAEAQRDAMATKLAALNTSSNLHANAWEARQALLREAWAARELSNGK